jgi:hypothetical protein
MKTVDKINHLLWRDKYIGVLFVFLFCFILFCCLQFQARFLDPDSFYHAKMAVLIKDQGIISNFPWLPFTVLNNYYIDQHLLYHVVLIPFVSLVDPLIGLKLATVVFAALFFAFFYWFLIKNNVRTSPLFNLVFTLFLLLAKPLIFRINLAKAPALSLVFLLVGFYLIVQRRYGYLFLFSFFYVYLYGGWPLILVVLGFYILVSGVGDYLNKRNEKRETRNDATRLETIISHLSFLVSQFFNWSYLKLIGSCLGGLVAGVVINPYFPHNLKFYWQQFVEIGIINYQKIVRVGAEWHPYGFKSLFLDTSILFLGLILALLVFIFSIKRQSRLSWVTLFLTLFFLAITLKSQRYVEYFVPFAGLFIALSLGLNLTKNDCEIYWRKFKQWYLNHSWVAMALCIFWFISLVAVVGQHWQENWHLYQASGRPFKQYQAAILWLKSQATPGTVVFHSDWDDFPQLFYYNSDNYYIAGLDPTFLYQASPGLYKKFENITLGKISNGLASEIKNTFQAEYIFVDPVGHDQLIKNLKAADNIDLVFEDGEAKIFKVNFPAE